MTSIAEHAGGDMMSPREVFAILRSRSILILGLAVLFAACAGVVSSRIPPSYQASMVLSPVTNSSSAGQLGALGALASQFGGLASIAGISGSGDSKKSESVAALQSEALTQRYIEQNNLLPVLFWKRWDVAKHDWKVSDPRDLPTLWKANQLFKSRLRTVTTDAKTGLVTLTLEWRDPILAALWANGLVKLTNDYLREQAIRESERNIAYLNEEASKTDAIGAKQAIYQILQNEINKVMLARGADEYALKVIDPAFAPERPSSLSVATWVAIGFATGLLIAIAAVLAMRRLSLRG